MSEQEHPNKIISGKCNVLGKADFSGISADILLGGENAPMTVMDFTVEPGQGAPTHVSHGEDKVFLIREGRFVFLVDTQKIQATEGDCIFISRETPHSFSVIGETFGRMTLISTPGLHDQFFKAMGGLPTPHVMEQVQSVCSCFGQTIVGPIVEA